ncbi:MAG: GtrA family protein [Bacteroidetes bacterium]|nr:GtrA family protein [Bacteroidota bacterium]MCB9227278.1 GtrA family protein [Chitinophagales bacterium]
MSAFWLTFSKFFVVGGLGFGIDVLTTFIFKEKLQLQKYTANSIGFFIGVTFRFFANKYWAFQNENPNWLWQMLQFGIIALIGLGIVNGVIFILHEKWKLMNFYPAKIVAMIVYMLWNFTANYLWTFG